MIILALKGTSSPKLTITATAMPVKTNRTEAGQFELDTPRDRAGSFESKLVKKYQRRFTLMDDKILFLYAQGMTTREIVTTFKEMYGADVSATLISKVTDAVIEQVVGNPPIFSCAQKVELMRLAPTSDAVLFLQ